jgi:hypothetical protein
MHNAAVAFGGVGIRELNIANRSVEHAVELQNKLRGVGMDKVVVHPLLADLDGVPRTGEVRRIGRGYVPPPDR